MRRCLATSQCTSTHRSSAVVRLASRLDHSPHAGLAACHGMVPVLNWISPFIPSKTEKSETSSPWPSHRSRPRLIWSSKGKCQPKIVSVFGSGRIWETLFLPLPSGSNPIQVSAPPRPGRALHLLRQTTKEIILHATPGPGALTWNGRHGEYSRSRHRATMCPRTCTSVPLPCPVPSPCYSLPVPRLARTNEPLPSRETQAREVQRAFRGVASHSRFARTIWPIK
jgi:hypothetical protein